MRQTRNPSTLLLIQSPAWGHQTKSEPCAQKELASTASYNNDNAGRWLQQISLLRFRLRDIANTTHNNTAKAWQRLDELNLASLRRIKKLCVIKKRISRLRFRDTNVSDDCFRHPRWARTSSNLNLGTINSPVRLFQGSLITHCSILARKFSGARGVRVNLYYRWLSQTYVWFKLRKSNQIVRIYYCA